MVKESLSVEDLLLVWSSLLGRVSIGKRDGKHADILLGYKVAIQVRQAHQSCSHHRQQKTGMSLPSTNKPRKGLKTKVRFVAHWRGTPAWGMPW